MTSIPTKKQPLPKAVLKRSRELRTDSTDGETRLWSCLRDRRLFGFKFRRQQPVDSFIVDFYCDAAKLAVEVDGGQHDEERQAAYDRRRTHLLEASGITVLRFWNNDVLKNLHGVLEAIAEVLGALGDPHPSPLPGGEGIGEEEAGLGRDR